MEERKREKESFEQSKLMHKKKLEEVEVKLKEAETTGGDVESLKKAMAEILLEGDKLVKKEKELQAKEKVTPWNVDTISNPGFTKTVINKKSETKKEELTEEERERRMKQFIKENEKILKQYGMLRKFDDSQRFLQEHPQLICEDTANYLVIWCINLEMEEKKTLSQHVAHQCICMQYILELSKQLSVDPRACVASFFTNIQNAEPEYKASFDDELRAFKERVSRRAKEKLEGLIKEQEEEERQARLGPGGLDPVEVFDSLPSELKECFEKQDIPLLQETIAKMPHDEAAYHMKRCVDSGLWLPEGGKKQEDEAGSEEKQESEPNGDEEKV
ncbi:hypothetical protein AAG570_010977 [Ranatra chinensis]